jgi:hypothetical protein
MIDHVVRDDPDRVALQAVEQLVEHASHPEAGVRSPDGRTDAAIPDP